MLPDREIRSNAVVDPGGATRRQLPGEDEAR
jgi:hypothetical protein